MPLDSEMIEIGLLVTFAFLLIAIIASLLLRDALKKMGASAEASMEDTSLIAIGMPPISSVKVSYIFPWKKLPGCEKLSGMPKAYLFITRAAFFLALLSVIVSAGLEVWS